jgi:DNA-directed RNA polymerase subunit RPC12/RpoP
VQVNCTQCGASLTVGATERLLDCPYCDTAIVVDGSQTLFHEVMLPTVKAADTGAHLRRFLGGRDTVANLDQQAVLSEPVLEYFPFWAFTVAGERGDQLVLQPAAPSSLQGLQGLSLPAGNTRPMDPEVTGEAAVIEPEVPMETAREWLSGRFGDGVQVRRSVLYHLPLYRTPYSCKGETYRAAVDGVTGKVFPADFPAKAEAPYVLVAVLALAVFAVEGLLISNPIVKLLAYAVSAIPILGLAWMTSRKV